MYVIHCSTTINSVLITWWWWWEGLRPTNTTDTCQPQTCLGEKVTLSWQERRHWAARIQATHYSICMLSMCKWTVGFDHYTCNTTWTLKGVLLLISNQWNSHLNPAGNSCWNFLNKTLQWGVQAMVPHCRGLGLIPSQSMWDFLWTQWQWESFISQYFSFCPFNIIPPILHTDSFSLIHSFICLSPTPYNISNWQLHYTTHSRNSDMLVVQGNILFLTTMVMKWANTINIQKFCILPTECIDRSTMIHKIHSVCFPNQHYHINHHTMRKELKF